MAGIYPDGGVPVGQATNSVNVATASCTTELFYSTNRCTPRFEPAAQNALISEILNAATALGDAYNCGELDNLKEVLIKINNLCNQPTNADPDINDFLAGCFDGVSGKASIQAISDLILGEIPDPTSLCALPAVATPDLDDSLAGCFDGVQGRTLISALVDLISTQISAGAPVYRQGVEILFPNGDEGGDITDIFSLADCDGLYIQNPSELTLTSGGVSTVLIGTTTTPISYNSAVTSVYFVPDSTPEQVNYRSVVTMERLPDGTWYMFGATRVRKINVPVPDINDVSMGRENALPDGTRVWKIHKI